MLTTLKVGNTVSVTHNLLHIYTRGTVIQTETCFFRVKDDCTGNIHTFHWNDDIEINIMS